MLSKFISNWIHIVFIVWIVLHISKSDVTKFNISYLLYLLCFGYIGYLGFNLLQGYQYELSFIIFNLITHIVPLVIFVKLGYKSNKYSKYVFSGVIVIYMLYLFIINKDVFDVYFKETQIISFSEVFEKCEQTEESYIPLCYIMKLLKSLQVL
jgi:hypothetical protein